MFASIHLYRKERNYDKLLLSLQRQRIMKTTKLQRVVLLSAPRSKLADKTSQWNYLYRFSLPQVLSSILKCVLLKKEYPVFWIC